MGLDMTVSFTKEYGTDVRGNYLYLETVVGNLRNCWETLNHFEIENCATGGVLVSQLQECLEDETIPDFEKDRVSAVIDELKAYNMGNPDDIVDVHVWY